MCIGALLNLDIEGFEYFSDFSEHFTCFKLDKRQILMVLVTFRGESRSLGTLS